MNLPSHRLGRSAFDVAVTVGGHTDHRPFGNVEHFAIDLELPGSGEYDVILLVLLVGVEERNGSSAGKRAERDFARCGADSVLYKLFSLEAVE